jgi:putative methylase
VCSDVCDFESDLQIDTVFQNPPFGSQKKAKRGQDLMFVKKACKLDAEVLYSFHMASTEEFLINYYNENNLEITHLFKYKFPIPKIYDFHSKEKTDVDVIVLRAVL